MDIEKIIRAWKAEEDEWETSLVANPLGRELTEEDLLAVSGADCSVTVVCTYTCAVTECGVTQGCGMTNACGPYSACSCSLSGATGI